MSRAKGFALDDGATAADPTTDAASSDDAQIPVKQAEIGGAEEQAEIGGAEETDNSAESAASDTDIDEPREASHRINWQRAAAFGLLPTLSLLLAAGAAYFKWQDSSPRVAEIARAESVQAAHDSTIALLSYQPDTVDQQLGAAQDLLAGQFRDSYSQLTRDVVIPGAKQKQISTVASVPAVASVSATPSHAVALVFVDQTMTIGNDAPVATASSVRVTLDKEVDGRWLISGFDPL